MVKVITKLFLFISAWILQANGQSSVVSPTTIMAGDQYTLTCDMWKIPTQRKVRSVYSFTLYRQTPDAQSSLVAQYSSIVPQGFNHTAVNPPPGLSSTWNFTFTGANGGLNNKDSMRIIVNVQNGQCNDAAGFICSAHYFYSGEIFEIVNSSLQNLTVEAATTIHPIKVEPAHKGGVAGDYVYNDGDNVTLTCTVRGPVGAILSWELYKKDTVGGRKHQAPLPLNAKITSAPGVPASESSGCSVYNYVSTLMYQVAAQTEPNILVCIAKRSEAELARANVTISTSDDTVPPTDSSADGCSSSAFLILAILLMIYNVTI